MNEQQHESSTENTEEHPEPGTEAPTDRPVFVWVLSIVMLLYALGGLIAGVVTGRLAEAPIGVVMVVAIGLLGVGLWFGMRWVLTLLRVVWVLFCVVLALSFLAASSMGGPNWGHGVGLVFVLMLIPIWSESVKTFCSKTDEDLR